MLSFDIIAQILWTSLATSSYVVLFTLAFALVLKVNRIFNFAQAALMTISFYAAYSTVALAALPGAAGLVAGLAASLVGALIVEWLGFRILRRRRAAQMFVFIFTLIVSELVAYVAMLIFGTWPLTVFPSLFWPVSLIGNVAVSTWDVWAVAAMAASLCVLALYLRFARMGQFMIAVADNPDLAELYGIAKARVFLAAQLVAAALVAVGMFLYGTRSQVLPTTAIDLMLFAVAATIIGGIGNLGGAVVAALALSAVQNAAVLFMPSEWQGFLLYVFLFFAIIFLPNGLRLPRRKLRRTVAAQPLLTQES
jgi:branched-subunit amino acid ABC-type transport system permease component